MNNNNFTFWELIKQHRIEIPVIQRDYAMGRDNTKAEDIRNSFISQIEKSLSGKTPPLHLNFVYGKIKGKRDDKKIEENKEAIESMLNAVKSYSHNLELDIDFSVLETTSGGNNSPQTIFIPLDGQQRLTTLFLLHWYIIKQLEENKRPENYKSVLSNFTYRIRPSSKDFCKALVEEEIKIEDNKNISDNIIDAPWFYDFWRKDPTVKGMLTVLDVIHNQFHKKNQEDFLRYREALTETLKEKKRISFEFLDLDQLKLTDDLYIKMNARGKPLTDFENFKAWLMDYIKDENIEVTIKDWQKKMDVEWADLFWIHKDYQNYQIDEEYMRFIRNMAQIFYIRLENFKAEGETDEAKKWRENASWLATDKGHDGEYMFFPYDNYGEWGILTQENINELFNILEILVDSEKGIKNYSQYLEGIKFFNEDKNKQERNLFEAFITGNMTYSDKVRFYAMVQFLLQIQGTEFNDKAFFQWMRVCRNLIENTTIDNVPRFKNAVKGVKNLINNLKKKDQLFNLYGYLANSGEISGFDGYQTAEEKRKSTLIKKDSDWEELFLRYENHPYFKGQINFLLELAKDDKDQINKNRFLDYAEKCATIFSEKLEKDNSATKNYIFERALLTQGNYLIRVNSNFSFISMFTPSGKNRDWRTRFFRDDNKLGLLKQLLDKINNRDIFKSIDDLIKSEKSSINDWKKVFIDNPRLLHYLSGKRYVRPQSEHGFVLFQGEKMSGAHAELYSLAFFYNYLEGHPIAPFSKSDYFYAARANKKYSPCAYLDSWNDKTFAIDIHFVSNEYEIRFFNREAQGIHDNIKQILINRGMWETDKYDDESFIITKDNQSDTFDELNSLCQELQNV